MAHLVDTDILIDLTRNNRGAIDYIDGLKNVWSISTITGLELIAGARSKREVVEIDRLLKTYELSRVTERIERRAYAILTRYAKSHGLRTFDSLIATTAIETGVTLATKDRKHFDMIEGLALEIPKY